jgi:16S rRNA (guanine966-N2)-methyltransferase
MNQLRIIGGEWKRRLIRFESVQGLRPTPDRVRETLFNWLMWNIGGANVLDLCAGSGALGLESLSRGAAHCVFIETDRKQALTLSNTLADLGAKARASVLHNSAQQAITRLSGPFDVVFLDPPYALNLWTELAMACEPLLSPHAWIYVEADRALDSLDLPATWQLHRHTRAGTVYAGLYQRQSSILE